MKLRNVILGAAVFSIAWSSAALSQTPAPAAAPVVADPVKLTVSRAMLLAIGQALQELPAKTANPILNDLQAQLNAADKAAADDAAVQQRAADATREALKEKATESKTEAKPAEKPPADTPKKP